MSNITIETIGCDLGDKTSEICVLGTDGIKRRSSGRTTRKGMTLFFNRARAHVVIEVGGHSRWVRKLLEELGHQVTGANPRPVKEISQGDGRPAPTHAVRWRC